MIGRAGEIKRMKALLSSDRSEFLAVTGRRRVGKTYMIDNVFKRNICFRMTGIQDRSAQEQLFNFAEKLAEHSNKPFISPPENWQEAFLQLKGYLQTLDKRSKRVIFIDELPWVHTPRSGFLQMLAHLWNDYLSKEKHFVLVICGSATSWITNRIINDPGGLHNRLTEIIHLQPFTLSETTAFLKSLQIRLTHQEVAKLYMAMGGIPYYLEKINKGESAAAAIERLCLTDGGVLRNEYHNLYKALFHNASDHEAIVRVLARSRGGIQREEIIQKSKVQAGGPYDRAMSDLIISGFVTEEAPYERKKRGALYRLHDEYSIFYHRFIKTNRKYTKGMWQQLASSQGYKIWSGYAFEGLCFKHIDQIKEALGISAVYAEISNIRIEGTKAQKGFQVDMIIDRKDDTINLCEIKYYSGPFTITKAYARKLIARRQQFIEHTGTKKQVFITFITNHGVVDNQYAKEVVDAEVVLESLMK